MGGNLDGIRVLDLTTEPGFLTGMLLGELGADVVKIEPPSGDAARRRGPFWGGIDDPERSLVWLALNGSKRGITLDVDTPRGRDVFLRLAARADVVLESERPGRMTARGLGWDVLHATNPRLILSSLTPFGQTGPYADWRASDLTAVAMSGNLHCTGDPDRAFERAERTLAQRLLRLRLRDGCAVPNVAASIRAFDGRLRLVAADGRMLGDCDGSGTLDGDERGITTEALPRALSDAAYDLALITEDGSDGVHNPAFAFEMFAAIHAALH